MIPLLERINRLRYLAISTVLELILYPAFLLLPGIGPKIVLLGLLGLLNAGWYAVLQDRLHSTIPGQSGTALAVGSVAGLVGSFIPFGLGWVAQRYNIEVTKWILVLGLLALLVGLPWRRQFE